MSGGRETSGITPIDIRSPGFFWLVQPWKEGTLATIDRWGRFAEISFEGANRIRIRHLVNFPRTSLDRKIITWPEAGLIAGTSGKMHHLAAIDDNKTKSHVPLLSWVHRERNPVLFDSGEGLVGYAYSLNRDDNDIDTRLFVYNYKEDRMVYESPESGFTILPVLAMDNQNIFSWERRLNGNRRETKNIFHNWRTNEIIENELTKTLRQYRIGLILRLFFNIHLGRRILFGYSSSHNQRSKVSWDENYSDIMITPLSYLLPAADMLFSNFIISSNGAWASTFITGYQGLNNDRLSKRAFFHLDGRYPNGISMPVITEDYENSRWDYSAFVEHPVHGMCFAQEWHKGRQLYLRLYKMNDVLAEINRQLWEKAEGRMP